MKETWRDIPGYEGKYQADTEGNVRRLYKSGKVRLMTPYHKKMNGSQRLVVKLTIDGKSKEEILIQVIARTFLGPLPGGPRALSHQRLPVGQLCEQHKIHKT